MEAYLSIGQAIDFDMDFNNLMPAVNRTSGTVQQAKKQINLPKDKLKYALFWFVEDSSSAHAMNQLILGDYGKANDIFEIGESFATCVNKAVVAMIRNDLEMAIANITEMIHDNGLRSSFVNAICGDVFAISENDLAHLFIDTLLEEISASKLLDLFRENGHSKDDYNYLCKKAVDEPVLRINAEIAKAKAVKRGDAFANYIAGKVLMKNTKSDLQTVKSMLGTSDMKYQMLADDLAETILQCGINYFNNTDDNDSIEKALVLQEYACIVAVGKMCKDRCNENVKILKKQKDEAVINSDITFIANKLEAFQSQFDTVENARTFVNECVPHLNNIKNQLGSTNSFYLKISSAVAGNALGMLVSVINEAQLSSHGLKAKVDSAMLVMRLIGKLDMDSNTRNRFMANQATLQSIQLQLQLSLSSTSSHPSSSSSGGCYIATMCYGNYDHPQVLVLRDFRDSILQQHSWGRAFVRFYYRNSPNWVEHLKDKKMINRLIRKILDKFIILYKYVKK